MKANNRELDHYERVINLPQTLNAILLLLMGSGFLALISLLLARAETRTLISVSMLTLVSIALFILNTQGYHKLASFGPFFLVAFVLIYNQVVNNGLFDVALLAYPALIVFSSLLLGTKFVVPISGVMIAVVSVIQKLTDMGIVTPYEGRLTTNAQDYWTIVAAIAITGAIVYIIMSIIEKNVTNILISEEHIKLVYESTLKGWARALELRDHETEGHSQRVTELTIALAGKLGITGEALTNVRWGALLHDIGKMSVPDEVLLKPGRLTKEEFDIIKEHPTTARTLLGNIPYLQSALAIPYGHHERWDGSGYPRGLKGEDIPLPARIFAVIDVWDALHSERPYKKAWSDEETIAYLKENIGSHFDPNVVYAFEELLEEERNTDNIVST